MDHTRDAAQLMPVGVAVVQVVRPSGFSKRQPVGAGTVATARPSRKGAVTGVVLFTVTFTTLWSLPAKESPPNAVDTVTVCAPAAAITSGVAKVKVALAPEASVAV